MSCGISKGLLSFLVNSNSLILNTQKASRLLGTAIVDYICRPPGKRVFWHSSAHVLGEAAERHYGCHLCIGPPTEEGFFYEMAIEDRPVTAADYPVLEKISDSAIKEKQKFERLMVPKETLLEMFSVSLAWRSI